jgi:hypothetical protein
MARHAARDAATAGASNQAAVQDDSQDAASLVSGREAATAATGGGMDWCDMLALCVMAFAAGWGCCEWQHTRAATSMGATHHTLRAGVNVSSNGTLPCPALLPPLRVAVWDSKRGVGSIAVSVVRQAFGSAGFKVFDGLPGSAELATDFDVLWTHHALPEGVSLTSTQTHNHIPGMSVLCHKAQFGAFAHERRFEFVPRYYTSSERDAAYLEQDVRRGHSRFIVKGRHHRGVRMLSAAELRAAMAPAAATAADTAATEEGGEEVGRGGNASDIAPLVALLEKYLVQQFIPNALLLDGHKFDVGVYVFIDSFAPSLRAYALENVLVRVVPKPFPTSEVEWQDDRRLIVQDEYLSPWSMPSLRRLWRHNARQAVDAYHLRVRSMRAGILNWLRFTYDFEIGPAPLCGGAGTCGSSWRHGG